MTHHVQQIAANVVPLADVAEWAIKAVLMLMLGTIVKIAWSMAESIKVLNIKMALVVDHITDHDKKLDRHDSRIMNLEKRRN